MTALIVLYGILLFSLSRIRPFWVDELLQLFGTRDLSVFDLPAYLSTFPGAAPIGYFAQHWAISILGFSPFSASLASELPSLLGCLGILAVLGQFRLRDKYGLSILCWILLPLQLRYGIEARPYALALLFSILSTWCFFRLLENPSRRNGTLYCVALILGLYTARYTLFVQVGYVFWAMFFKQDRSVRLLALAALAIAGLVFSPWYWAAANYWKHYLAVTADVGFKFTPKFILLPIQEISGGYLCSVPLILLAIIGGRSQRLSRPLKSCLLTGIVFGLVCVLVTDLTFGYFFAVRQIMFILVPIFVLAASGIENLLYERQRSVLAVLISVLVVGSVVKNVRYFSDQSEDWGAAAISLKAVVSKGACLKYVGTDDPIFYNFFDSSLAEHICPGRLLKGQPVAVPFTRYTAVKNLEQTKADLLKSGFKPQNTVQAGGTTLVVYDKELTKAKI